MNKVLKNKISKCEVCILYRPLKGEIDYTELPFPINLVQEKVYIPNNKNSNPFEHALKLSLELSNKKVYLLIPGTTFDIYGTRHGHGGGWYDKFLSKIPKNWIRIGIVEIGNFSNTRIEKNIWDEPMDWVLIRSKNVWEVVNCTEIDKKNSFSRSKPGLGSEKQDKNL